jgi:hypothetical protein
MALKRDLPIFYLHFFEKYNVQQSKSNKSVGDMLNRIEGCEMSKVDNNTTVFTYTFEKFDYCVYFKFTDRSALDNISAINPEFKDLKFHIEFDMFCPNFIASKIFEFCKYICQNFNYYIYCDYLPNVSSCDENNLIQLFKRAKKVFGDKYPSMRAKYYYVPEDTLSKVFDYLMQVDNIKGTYGYQTVVQDPVVLIDEKKEVFFAANYDYYHVNVFPPCVDYLIYEKEGDVLSIDYHDFLGENSKYLNAVVGMKDSFVTDQRRIGKINNFLYRNRLSKVLNRFTPIDIKELIDY